MLILEMSVFAVEIRVQTIALAQWHCGADGKGNGEGELHEWHYDLGTQALKYDLVFSKPLWGSVFLKKAS